MSKGEWDWQGKRALITGGAGMIGSQLAELLLTLGAEVHILDDFSRGDPKNIPAGVGAVHRVTLGKPLQDAQKVAAFRDQDVVFHLAARVAGINYNMAHDWVMLMDNLAINEDVSTWVERIRPRRYVYVSTSCVYPHAAPVPTPESAGEICNPEPTNRGYGIAKWVGEQMALELHRKKLPTGIVRFFNACGPRDYYDWETSHVIPALIRRFVRGDSPVVVWGTGDQTRSFVDCRDLAKGLLVVAEKGCDGKATNIGHQREVTIRDLALLIQKLTGSTSKLVFDLSKPDGYPRRAADTTRFVGLSEGWLPTRPLEETVDLMIRDYRSRPLD